MKRILFVLAACAVAITASCALPLALVHAADQLLTGKAREAHIATWVKGMRGETLSKTWQFADTGHNAFGNYPIVEVTIPGKRVCLVAIDPNDATLAQPLICAPVAEKAL